MRPLFRQSTFPNWVAGPGVQNSFSTPPAQLLKAGSLPPACFPRRRRAGASIASARKAQRHTPTRLTCASRPDIPQSGAFSALHAKLRPAGLTHACKSARRLRHGSPESTCARSPDAYSPVLWSGFFVDPLGGPDHALPAILFCITCPWFDTNSRPPIGPVALRTGRHTHPITPWRLQPPHSVNLNSDLPLPALRTDNHNAHPCSHPHVLTHTPTRQPLVGLSPGGLKLTVACWPAVL